MSDQQLSRAARNGRQKKTTKKNHSKAFKITRAILLTLVGLGVVGTVIGGAVFAFWASSAPKITNQQLVGTSQSTMVDANNKVIWTSGNQKREIAQQAEYPKLMKEAVVAIEDRRFYQHGGVDLKRIIGAAFANVTGSSLGLQGGSTLTQQLVKQTVFSSAVSDQTFKRKAQEAWLATRIEKEYSKAQILTLYMNKVYLGNGVYGMKTAAQYYFGKEMKDLSVPQIALIAGLPQSPSGYDPYTNPKGAKYRRDQVLQAMSESGAITKSEAKKYQQVPIDDGLLTEHTDEQDSEQVRKVSDSYITSVLSELKAKKYDVNKDGLTIKTNLDLDIQQKAYDVVNASASNQYGIPYPNDEVQAALTITDPQTGDVIAQIGNRKQEGLSLSNLATSTGRSGGSTVKPLVDYAPAIENLNWPTYRAVDDSTSFKYAGTSIYAGDAGMSNLQPYSKQSGQPYVTMRNALSRSLNVPALHTLQGQSILPNGGTDEFVGYSNATAFLKKLGIDVSLEGSSAIGFNISTEQAATAFAAFANGGMYYAPAYINTITTQDGKVHNLESTGKRAMKTSTAFMMNSMLQSVLTSTGTFSLGFQNYVHSSYVQGAKSGTVAYASDSGYPSSAATDLWFTGFTKSASISVWTGYKEPNKTATPLNGLTGTTAHLPNEIYDTIMQYVMRRDNRDGSDWKQPSTVKKVSKYGKTEYEVSGNAKFTDPFANRVRGNYVYSSSSSTSKSSSSSESSESSSSSSEPASSSAPSVSSSTPSTQ
ncbi:penicillin-binding protein [Weissella diestrammenae]|uniref:Penicillin-binding protein n=1 Tax=Weissella diestrammenae TaxID=1162633 RepID=A0A7G9T4U5_9LACO|nr:transglycosylase domain-containing protein [Weissella diestrammenae]MCM0582833.1 penicillin-binding protein [Weissella diestrammenae]QNN75120.1 penicillin-binding protein [Weissella diestrammenae]